MAPLRDLTARRHGGGISLLPALCISATIAMDKYTARRSNMKAFEKYYERAHHTRMRSGVALCRHRPR